MTEHIVRDLAVALGIGIGAQWLAWRIRFPAILLLLVCGIAAGPWLGLIDPDVMMGNMLVPIVSISVALILFEGGMSLKRTELNQVGKVVRNLVTTGALLTWLLISLAAWGLLGVDPGLALLIGAVLVVTGPTVIGPLLRHVRPSGQVGPALKWEGIYIDPIGALLAVLVFEGLLAGSFHHAGLIVLQGLGRTIIVGLLVGGLGAAVMVILLKRNWIPEYLDNPLSLILVICSFSLSNHWQEESGLFTVTLMGTLLANQKFVSIRHITRFKEDLRVLLISFLFVILAARLRVEDFEFINAGSVIFLVLLIVVIRPLVAWLSTMGSTMTKQERIFIGLVAPRGIVAAAVSSVFALKLADAGYAGAEKLVPITFLVIMGTVFVYGLLASPIARLLGLSQHNPQGILIVGAHEWARELAKALLSKKVPVLMVDTNRTNIQTAKLDGIPAYHGNILNSDVREDLNLGGIGRLLALTPNDGLNAQAVSEVSELFERSQVYMLPAAAHNKPANTKADSHHNANILFGDDLQYSSIRKMLAEGMKIKKTSLNKEFAKKEFHELYGEDARPLFYIAENGNVTIVTEENRGTITPKAGTTIISLAPPRAVDLPTKEDV